MTILRRFPCQGWATGTSSVGFANFWSCGSERPPWILGMALASGDRGQPSAAFCTLGNPLNLVSELRDLMSWPPWPTSILGHGGPVALTQAHFDQV